MRVYKVILSVVFLSITGGASASGTNAAAGALTQPPGKAGCIETVDSGQDCTLGDQNSRALQSISLPSLAVSPQDDYLYAASKEMNSIVTLKRAADSSLSQPPGSTGCISGTVGSIPPGCGQTSKSDFASPQEIAITPGNGRFLYATSYNSTSGYGTITGFLRDSVSGALSEQGCVSSDPALTGCTPLQPYQGGALPAVTSAVAIDPGGKHLYVATSSQAADLGGTILSFSIANSGSLTQLDGKAGCTGSSQLTAAALKNGCETVNSLGKEIDDIVISPDGKNLYAVSSDLNTVTSFKINSDGSLKPITPGQQGECVSDQTVNYCRQSTVSGSLKTARSLTVNRDGTSLYVTNTTQNAISTLHRDGASGELTQLPSNSNGCWSDGKLAGCQQAIGLSTPYASTVSPDGFLFTTSLVSNSVAEFKLGADGSLEQLAQPDSRYQQTGTNGNCQQHGRSLTLPQAIAVTHDGASVYATGSGLATVTFDTASTKMSVKQINGHVTAFRRRPPRPDTPTSLLRTPPPRPVTPVDAPSTTDPGSPTVTVQGSTTPTPSGTPSTPETSTNRTTTTQPRACGLLSSLSSVTRWRHLPHQTAVRLRTVSGGAFRHVASSGQITLDARGINRQRVALKSVRYYLDGRFVGKQLKARHGVWSFKIAPSKLSAGIHTAKAVVNIKRSSKRATLRRSFAVRDCRPVRFSPSLSSLLRRAHPNLKLWVHSGDALLKQADFRLAQDVKIKTELLRHKLAGKRIGNLTVKDGRGKTLLSGKLIVPAKNSGSSIRLRGGPTSVRLTLGKRPAIHVSGLPENATQLTVTLDGTKTRLMRNVDSCAALSYTAILTDSSGAHKQFNRNRKLCSNRR